MCIIVDANKLGQFLADPPNDDSAPIHDWLNRRRGSGILVYSTDGRFKEEIGGKARIKLADYARSGKAKLIPAERFAADEQALRADGNLRSNDAHVLALARASGARLLYTGDGDLMDDFKDRRFIDRPRGKVYSRAANAKLLTNSACAQLERRQNPFAALAS